MVKVKICGITNLEDALASVDAGCDALGFLFYKKSPRSINPSKASGIIKGLPRRIIKIGVFVDAREKFIKKVARLCHLDMLQFHGSELPDFCVKCKGYKIIKAFRAKNRIDLKKIMEYNTFAYLFDTFKGGKLGGTGKVFNWKIIRHIKRLKHPIFLSGGLNAKNVKTAIKLVKPNWVDVCSSVEAKPGKKDHKKIKEFIETVKKTSQRGKNVTE